jgi:hypothetical protein
MFHPSALAQYVKIVSARRHSVNPKSVQDRTSVSLVIGRYKVQLVVRVFALTVTASVELTNAPVNAGDDKAIRNFEA